MILHNPYPGTLISSNVSEVIYESYCVSQFSESELKNIIVTPFTIIPSNNTNELIQYLGGILRFTNSGELLTDGSDLILKAGTVLTSDPIPNTVFLIKEFTSHVQTTNPPEEPYGVPITLVSNAEYLFEGGSNGAVISIYTLYRRIVKLN